MTTSWLTPTQQSPGFDEAIDRLMFGRPEPSAQAARARYAQARARVTFGAEFDESKHPRDHGKFADAEGGNSSASSSSGPTVVQTPTKLADVSPALRAEITDRYESTGKAPPAELTPSWQNAAAWDAVLSPEAQALENPEAAHPERYEPDKFGGGVHLKEGETEPRISRDVVGANWKEGAVPVVNDVMIMPKGLNIDTAAAAGYKLAGGMANMRPLVVVPGSERPPDSLYRVMSTAEYDQAKTNGYIKSDERMNLVSTEGTVTSLRSTGSFYAPTDGSDYRIARINYRDADGWKLDTDEYVKTPDRVPFSRVDAVTDVIVNHRKPITASGEFDESQHPRDEKGRFGDGGGSSVQPEAWQLAEPPSSSLPWAEQQAIRDQVTDAQNEYGAAHISEAGRTAFQGDSPEAQALRGYTIGDYHQVSAALRGQSGSVTDASTNKAFSTVGEQIAALDRGVAQGVVTNDMVVFRGAGNWAGGDLTPGSVVKDAGFVSTSLSREVAAGFNGPTFEITVPAGTHAAFTNANVYKVFHEAEVILPRDQSFVVTGQEGNVTRMTLK